MSKSHRFRLVQFRENRTRRLTLCSLFNHARYDIFGALVAEYTSQPSNTPAPCGTCYLSTDHLGSPRLITDGNHMVISRHDYTPFGEEIPGWASRGQEWGRYDSVNHKFTGQERDSETQLDFFHARYFTSAQGRFTSPDPANAGADIFNPQSWNAYAYVNNNPLNATDPTGLETWSLGGCYFNTAYAYVDGEYQGSSTNLLGCFGMGNGGYNRSVQESIPPPPEKVHVEDPPKTGTCPAVPEKPAFAKIPNIMRQNAQMNYTDWYNAVKNRGIWDFKQIRNLNDFGIPEKQSPYEDFGNFNYGMTAAQQGIPRWLALRGAGGAGQKAIGKNFFQAAATALGPAPYGDDPADQVQINAGYDYYVNHCY